jgi:hypothetical protein
VHSDALPTRRSGSLTRCGFRPRTAISRIGDRPARGRRRDSPPGQPRRSVPLATSRRRARRGAPGRAEQGRPSARMRQDGRRGSLRAVPLIPATSPGSRPPDAKDHAIAGGTRPAPPGRVTASAQARYTRATGLRDDRLWHGGADRPQSWLLALLLPLLRRQAGQMALCWMPALSDSSPMHAERCPPPLLLPARRDGGRRTLDGTPPVAFIGDGLYRPRERPREGGRASGSDQAGPGRGPSTGHPSL